MVWGVNGITFTGVTVSTTTAKMQSADMDNVAERKVILDGNGELVGQVFFDNRNKISVSFIPSGALISAAKTNMDTFTPAPGTVMTLVDTDGTGTFEAAYSVLSAKLARSATSEAMITVELERSVANAVTAIIAS